MSGDAWKTASTALATTKWNKLECDNGLYASLLNVLANNYSYSYVFNCGCCCCLLLIFGTLSIRWHECHCFLSTASSNVGVISIIINNLIIISVATANGIIATYPLVPSKPININCWSKIANSNHVSDRLSMAKILHNWTGKSANKDNFFPIWNNTNETTWCNKDATEAIIFISVPRKWSQFADKMEKVKGKHHCLANPILRRPDKYINEASRSPKT